MLSVDKDPHELTIFVSIACYRDHDLLNTIHDLYKKAEYPSRVAVGTCVQIDEDQDAALNYSILGLMNEDVAYSHNVRMQMVPYKLSRGAGWARNQIQENLFDNEDFYFQVDSHSRFIEKWDTILIEIFNKRKTSENKVTLSSYPATFEDYGKYLNGTFIDALVAIKADKFNGPVMTQASEQRCVCTPIEESTPYLTGGFIFAEGEFVHEVPYDPDMYFEGEESSLGFRAFTHGWDNYNPNRAVVFHDYARNGNRHWDHNPEWFKLDEISKNKYSDIVNNRVTGKFGLGNIRTHDDWEKLTGVNLINRTVTVTTVTAYPASPETTNTTPAPLEQIQK